LTKEGYLFLSSDRTRSQHLNTADALEKLREMIRDCEPAEEVELSLETLEVLRKRKEKAVRERLQEKRIKSAIKSQRGSANL